MKRIILITLILIEFVSCSSPPPRTVATGFATSSPAITPSREVTETAVILHTPVPSLAYPTRTLAPSPTPELFKTECLEIAPNITAQVVPTYALVLGALGDRTRYIYSFKTGKRSDFPEGNYPMSASVDGNWLIYKQYGNSVWLIVESYDKKIQRKYPVQDTWRITSFWISEERFSINLSQDFVPSVLAIDAKTGEQTILPSKYPNLEPYYGTAGSPYHFGGASVVYDPSLELAVYLKTIEDGRRYRRFITLYDRQTKTELASLEDEPSYPLRMPVWSLDGQQVIVASHLKGVDELFSIQRDGQVSQLTNFRSHYKSLKISGLSLSPDNRHLAFVLELPETSVKEQLIALNMETKEVVNLCVPSVGRPLWSPDSRYIAVDEYVPENRYRTILVDLQAKWAVQVTDYAYSIGWLKEP